MHKPRMRAKVTWCKVVTTQSRIRTPTREKPPGPTRGLWVMSLARTIPQAPSPVDEQSEITELSDYVYGEK